MAEKWLTVNEKNEVSEEVVHVKSGDDVVWTPAAGLKGEVVIEFLSPFKDSKWIKQGKGKKVSGKVKAQSNDDNIHVYTATFVPSDRKAKVNRRGVRAQPQIIVDGRRKRKTASKTGRAAASLPKAATKPAAAKRV